MKLIFTPIAQEHWEYWKKNDPNITKRIKKLLADILEHPYTGIGKPEPLKYELAGKWSRRINTEHRLILGKKFKKGHLKNHFVMASFNLIRCDNVVIS